MGVVVDDDDQPPLVAATNNDSGSVNTTTTMIGRVARKKKRSHGLELAIRLQDNPKQPPTVVYISKSEIAALVPHFAYAQLDALVKVESVEDTSVVCGRRVMALELLECPGEPQAVRAILEDRPDLWHTLRPIDMKEEDEDLEHARNRGALVRRIIVRLQRRQVETPRERPPWVKIPTLLALEALEKETNLVEIVVSTSELQNKISSMDDAAKHSESSDAGFDATKFNLLDNQNQKIPVQSAHGSLTRHEYLETKKHPQIQWLLQRLQKLPMEFRHVLDVGGGRGDLATLIAQQWPSIQVTVVDANQTSLEAGRAHATQQVVGLENRSHWICQDFEQFMTDQTAAASSTVGDNGDNKNDAMNHQASSSTGIDLVIAWHACGDLTDMAIDYGLRQKAAIVACPCCYSKLKHQTVATKLAELEGRPDLSRRGMHVVNSQRHKKIMETGNYTCVSLEEYSRQWSGRNQVLVAVPASGEPQNG